MRTVPTLRCPHPEAPAELVVAGIVFEVSDLYLASLIQKAGEILAGRHRVDPRVRARVSAPAPAGTPYLTKSRLDEFA